MKELIDIHSHILPGIDDGSPDEETSMEMLRLAAKDGTEEIILTPHNKPGRHCADAGKIEELRKQLLRNAQEAGIRIQLYCGNEFYYRSSLAEEIAAGNGCCLAGSDYVLTEFGPADDFDYIRRGIYSLLAAGFRPVLAHAERYAGLCSGTGRAEELAKMGCYIQINAGSIMGKAGFGTKLYTRKLLAEGIVHFVATDAHDTAGRPPGLSECAVYIRRKYGEDCVRKLFYENPMNIIRNEYL